MRKVDFPLLQNHPELVYLDAAATSLKPQVVLDAMQTYYTQYGANVSRGLYKIAERATQEFEHVRQQVADFIHASSSDEIIFMRNATEGLNLLAATLSEHHIAPGDAVCISIAEHHANFVPWQQMCQRIDAELQVLDLMSTGDIQDPLEKITSSTRVLALSAVSNVLGTRMDVRRMAAQVKAKFPECLIIIDACQLVAHEQIDVQDWGVDAVVFSGHKMFGPTGVGVLWARKELLNDLPPYQYGGDMIQEVRVDRSVFQNAPHKFEAGTPDIAAVIGLGAAVRYIQSLGFERIREHDQRLCTYALHALQSSLGDAISILGTQDVAKRTGLIAFTLKGMHPHDIAQIVDEQNVAIRAGHHCAMPLHTHLGIAASARISWSVWNDERDIDRAIHTLQKALMLLA